MASVSSLVRLICVATVLVLACAHVAQSARTGIPRPFRGWLPTRSRRSHMDNRIDTFPAPPQEDSPVQANPAASALGESIMDEFIMFLTLKDSGLLDMCLMYK